MAPFPPILLEVSGRIKATVTRHMPPRMDKNQKMLFQPSFSAMTPPRTGPNGGATLGLFLHEFQFEINMYGGFCSLTQC